MRLGLKAFVRVAWLLLASPASVFAQGTSEERRACTPDVLRLCSAFIPDTDQITACLRQKNAESATMQADHPGGNETVRQ